MKIIITLLALFISTQISAQSNINISNAPFFEGEPYLVIDPTNSQHLVTAWMGFTFGQEITIKTSVSDDGGLTWSTPFALAHEQAGNTSADASMGYNSNGDLFICYIDFENTNFSYGKIMVRKSTDNGVTWGTSVEAINITDCPNQLCIDRPWMEIDNSDRIFITSMNADQPTMINAPYNPYFVVSTDDGVTFSNPTTIDGPGFLAGSVITQPVPSLTSGADGTFYAAYPSYVFTQNVNAQLILAKSTDGGSSFNYSSIYAGTNSVSDPLAKRGFHILSDPTLTNHLIVLAIFDYSGDADIYLTETFDGATWSVPIRVNQDAVGNGKMQDLVWGAFNDAGDLSVCWRDRRNGSTSGYQTETEIYATVRFKDSLNFENDFVISSQLVNHDAILEGAGNDFMNLKFVGDTIYAVWGDVRTGTLNIFLNKTNVVDGTSSLLSITQEDGIISVYPNPSSEWLTIDNFDKINDALLLNNKGGIIQQINTKVLDISKLAKGNYLIIYNYKGKKFSNKFTKI